MNIKKVKNRKQKINQGKMVALTFSLVWVLCGCGLLNNESNIGEGPEEPGDVEVVDMTDIGLSTGDDLSDGNVIAEGSTSGDLGVTENDTTISTETTNPNVGQEDGMASLDSTIQDENIQDGNIQDGTTQVGDSSQLQETFSDASTWSAEYQSGLGYSMAYPSLWESQVAVVSEENADTFICQMAEEENYTGVLVRIQYAPDGDSQAVCDALSEEYICKQVVECDGNVFVVLIPTTKQYDQENGYVCETIASLENYMDAMVGSIQ